MGWGEERREAARVGNVLAEGHAGVEADEEGQNYAGASGGLALAGGGLVGEASCIQEVGRSRSEESGWCISPGFTLLKSQLHYAHG